MHRVCRVFDEPQCKAVCPIDEAIVVNPAFRETKEELLKKKLLMDKH